jgi:hypothetical protein
VPPAAVALLVRAVAILSVLLGPAAGVGAGADLDGPGDGPIRPEEGEVIRLYRSVLGRQPDPEGYGYWSALRVEGVPLAVVADGFLTGREYRRRFGAGTDAVFVERVYANVLGRPGDPEGAEYWRRELTRGLERTHLVLLFSESVESRRLSGTGLAELPEFRPADRTVVADDVAVSWRQGCPVGPGELRALEVDHVGFDARHHRGTLIVHQAVVDELTEVFRRLYAARYPIQSIRPVDEFGPAPAIPGRAGPQGADDEASMAANNTSAFNCRSITGGGALSRHARGTAIDLNPLQNPWVADRVAPAAAGPWLDRRVYHPAMIRPGDVVTRAFADAGWRWGGDFVGIKDYQHFQR